MDSLKLCYLRCNESRTQLLAWCVRLVDGSTSLEYCRNYTDWLRQQISFKVLVLTYQALHGTAPQYLTELLSWYQLTRSLRSSDSMLLTAPQRHLRSFGDRLPTEHLSVQPLDCATVEWTSDLPSYHSTNNLGSFKGALKTFLFRDSNVF